MPTPEMPAEHAILGLLDLDEGTGHGYDLARHFAEGQPLASVLRLESGMLYHHLKKMARHGWVTATVERHGSRPPRQVYRLTPAGRTELRRWLREPVAHTREIRLEFLVKLYFAQRFDSALASRLVREQLDICLNLERSLAARLSEAQAHDTERDEDRAFSRAVLGLRIAQTRAAASWLASLGPAEPVTPRPD